MLTRKCRLRLAGAVTRPDTMLRFIPLTLALFSALAFAGGPSTANAASEEVLRVNLIVADVTMLKGSGAMVVTGKGFGDTNLIALDAQGNVLLEKTVRVVPTGTVLIVQRGMERESYSCAPQCMPTVQLGDGKSFGDTSGQVTARNGLLAPSQGAQTQH
jgi:hypothetical protein